MKIETLFDIGDIVRPKDEVGFSNWGLGKVDEINFVKRENRTTLRYYVKMKRHSGYRLCLTEDQMILIQSHELSKKLAKKRNPGAPETRSPNTRDE